MPQHLFVYGSLRPAIGAGPFLELQQHGSLLSTAKIAGRLYEIDGFPGLLAAETDKDWVVGELFEVQDEAHLLPLLDRYEGCSPEEPQPQEYVREASTAFLPEGRTISCWVYWYNWPVESQKRIVEGDYVAWLASNP